MSYNNTILLRNENMRPSDVFSAAVICEVFNITTIKRTDGLDGDLLTRFRAGNNNYIIGVGKINDAAQRQFDDNNVSFCVVWNTYGKQYIQKFCEFSDFLHKKVMTEFVNHIDAERTAFPGVYTLHDLFIDLYEFTDEKLIQAVEIAKVLLRARIDTYNSDTNRKRQIFMDAFERRQRDDTVVLPIEIENITDLLIDLPQIKYVVSYNEMKWKVTASSGDNLISTDNLDDALEYLSNRPFPFPFPNRLCYVAAGFGIGLCIGLLCKN